MPEKPRRRMKKTIPLCLALLFLLGLTLALCFYNGVLQFNNPSRQTYPVRGVDVSAYQGEIDWETLAGQDIQFAFLKATEGSAHTDPRFQDNWDGARQTDLRVGAYHFFSYDSPGERQAAHFIATVPKAAGMLPPVVDVEFYGDKEKHPPEPEQVRAQLHGMLDLLEAHYGTRPILYATEKSYRLFLAGDFGEYDIWIRNVLTRPKLSDGRTWAFWQYSNRARLEGYQGKERFIDLNVFAGNHEAFARYCGA